MYQDQKLIPKKGNTGYFYINTFLSLQPSQRGALNNELRLYPTNLNR